MPVVDSGAAPVDAVEEALVLLAVTAAMMAAVFVDLDAGLADAAVGLEEAADDDDEESS